MLVLGLKARPQQQIAVVEMEGAIGPRLKAPEFVKLFRSIEENDHIRAVVLDIDSPGGSATASNYLYLAVKSLAKKKPVVAFIRGVGASGSYLFSCPAQKIVAIPGGLIGSIGVISMRPLIYEALDRVGVKVHVAKSAEFKDMGSMFREPTDEESAKEQRLINDLYEEFLEAVAEGRHMDMAQVKSVATGEVYTSRRARELGLVDELGDLEKALAVAGELGGVGRSPIWMKPRKGLRELVTTGFAGSFAQEIAAQFEERITSRYQFRA